MKSASIIAMLMAGAMMAPAMARGAGNGPEALGLKHQWFIWNLRCRGYVDMDRVEKACNRRDRVSARLEARGLCLGNNINKTGGLDSTWKPCWPPR
jgi:hypothetical protein